MQKIGIGYENYKRMIDDGCYYVDKTLLIRDVVRNGGMVTLFTRPRRFGKTLAISMLRTFFEKEYNDNGTLVDNSQYFEGMKILSAEQNILSMMGRYPVISLSLKAAKQPNFRTAFLMLRNQIISEFERHAYLGESKKLSDNERTVFSALSKGTDEEALRDDEEFKREVGRYSAALQTLSVCLKKHHGERVIILLDEYDVPLENAYFSGFYNEMVGFVRSLFESALKTNDALERAVVTGCLRISKESIFTGLNHLQINSIRSESFSEGFGFTQLETDEFLTAYGLEEKIQEVRDWYDGYLFGKTEIYNPWSVINYIYSMVLDGKEFPEPYWPNTSSNQIIKDLVYHASESVADDLDCLINGGTVEKQIHEDITYEDINESEDNLWNFLFFTGYMKKVSERQEGKSIYITMKIPNMEIGYIYETQIKEWMNHLVKDMDRTDFYRAVLEGNKDCIVSGIENLLEQSISTFDSEEAFYHGFLLSLLLGIKNYHIQSNREEGNGRPDITLLPKKAGLPAVIFEVKVSKTFKSMQAGLRKALTQIRDKKYVEGILSAGYERAIAYGICFCKKSCVVESIHEYEAG